MTNKNSNKFITNKPETELSLTFGCYKWNVQFNKLETFTDQTKILTNQNYAKRCTVTQLSLKYGPESLAQVYNEEDIHGWIPHSNEDHSLVIEPPRP